MSLLVESHVRAFTFEAIRHVRPSLQTKMKRVSDEFLNTIETRLRVHIFNDVRNAQNQEAKTLKPVVDEPRPQGAEWLVNQTSLHDFIRTAIKELAERIELVSSAYIESCDNFVRRAIESHLDRMPSVGQTIK